MTRVEKLVEALDAIDGYDSEGAHVEVDNLLLEYVPSAVAEAVANVRERSGGFWYA
jgi:hypothetical protein